MKDRLWLHNDRIGYVCVFVRVYASVWKYRGAEIPGKEK